MSAFSDVSGFGQQRFGTLNLNIQPIEALNQCWPESARRNRQTCHWFSGVSGLHCDLRSGKSCSEVNEISRNLRMLRTDFWHGKRTFDVSCRRRIRIYWPAKMIASGGGDYDRIRRGTGGTLEMPGQGLPAIHFPLRIILIFVARNRLKSVRRAPSSRKHFWRTLSVRRAKQQKPAKSFRIIVGRSPRAVSAHWQAVQFTEQGEYRGWK